MANSVLLNNIDHKNLHVITERNAKYGDNLWFSLTFPMEFRSVQAHYPIFFNKDAETGKFFPVALFGFQQQENLFLDDNHWDAPYIPVTVKRQPFMIGLQQTTENGVVSQQRVLHIDLDNPRVSETQGTPLFLEFGGNSPYLDHMADMMEALHQGMQENEQFIAFLLAYDLLEPVTVDIVLNDQSKNEMIGFYTINEEKMKTLADDVIASAHKAGFLQAIYMTFASQGQLRALIERKNKHIA